MSDRKQAAVVAAMEVLFTKRQIAFIKRRTACGPSKLDVIRRAMNAAIREDEKKWAFLKKPDSYFLRDYQIPLDTPPETG